MIIKKLEYSIDLKFESITLPPFKDILILGINCPHGRLGVEKGFQLLSIDLFTVVEIEDNEIVSYVFINNYLFKKIPEKEILEVLEENVFPYMSASETIKVDLDLYISVRNINGKLN